MLGFTVIGGAAPKNGSPMGYPARQFSTAKSGNADEEATLSSIRAACRSIHADALPREFRDVPPAPRIGRRASAMAHGVADSPGTGATT